MIAISVIVKFFVPDSVAPVPNVRRRVVMIQKRLTLDEFIVVNCRGNYLGILLHKVSIVGKVIPDLNSFLTKVINI